MTPDPTNAQPDPAARARARRRGIVLVLIASATFALAAAAAKAIGAGIPVAEVILFRNLFAIPLLLPVVMASGGWGALATRNPMSHAARTLFGLMGMVGAFYGYVHLPIATVTALGFTMPLFLTVLSVPLLGERVGWRRGLAVLVGFAGVLLMVRPGSEGLRGEGLAVLLCLLGSVGWALAMITIRRMGEAGESSVAIVFWFAVGSAVIAGIAAVPVWVWPSPLQWALLFAIGSVSALAQVLMTSAYRSGETTLLAPFEYAGIVWTTALGAFIWAELPDGWDFAGIAVLVGAGLYIWHREVALGVKR
ncbi:DMT family transporter [Roseomonas sp. PWR1]|uniref:DMT family transporter n=1 Tax=Roseomonas nitratireducens TaxID=2820810 RepID=A0ABS4AP46_9PROT|nr:DMT family transporter [Neoroseomonas nitratireducens]MBP0463004.1 DMT family transporter [Neoroseomonas nitratireducens]